MDTVLKPDLCVVGAGTEGARAALAARSRGARVVMIDDGLARAESTGRNVMDALIGTARRHGAPGIGGRLPDTSPMPEPDFAAIMARARAVAATLSAEFSPERLIASGIHVIRSDARFTDRKTLVAGNTVIRARRYLVATGSMPVRPPLTGLSEIDVLTVDQLSALSRRPAHLIVLGNDATGLELAQAFHILGSRVTLLSGGPILPSCDREIAGFLQRRLLLQGVSIRAGADPVGLERRGRTGIRLTLRSGERQEAMDASHLLLTDSEPRLGGLDLARADAGRNRRIDTAAGNGRSSREIALVRTDPALAWAGADAEPSPGRHGTQLLRMPLSAAECARGGETGPGLLKLAVDRDGRILSAAMAGGPAPDHIGLWRLAMEKGSALDDLAAMPAPDTSFLSLVGRAHAAFAATRPSPGLWRRMLGRRQG